MLIEKMLQIVEGIDLSGRNSGAYHLAQGAVGGGTEFGVVAGGIDGCEDGEKRRAGIQLTGLRRRLRGGETAKHQDDSGK